jgi:hypothetical protein
MSSRRSSLRRALLALPAAALLVLPAGCGAGSGVERPASYIERPTSMPELGGGGGKGKVSGAKGGAKGGGAAPAEPQ